MSKIKNFMDENNLWESNQEADECSEQERMKDLDYEAHSLRQENEDLQLENMALRQEIDITRENLKAIQTRIKRLLNEVN